LKNKPLVYVASPYTKGHAALNVRFQCDMFNEILQEDAVTPLTPLWSHFQEIIHPRPYEDWMTYDFELIAKCDAVLALNVELPHYKYFQTKSSGHRS